MRNTSNFAALLQGFFTQRLMQQRQASPYTIASYQDTFRLLLQFAQKHLHKAPAQLALEEVNAPLIAGFLEDLEKNRGTSPRSRNLRLTAVRSFFRYAAYEAPAHAGQIQRVLAIPSKRYDRVQVEFLTRPEIEAVLKAPNQETSTGRRDYVLLLVAVQTGLRLSELISLKWADVMLGKGAHVRCIGKGRKERCTPLTRQARTQLKARMRDLQGADTDRVFSNIRGGPLSGDGVRYILAKHVGIAARDCPSLRRKNVTPHVLRHTMAMELLQAGVDRAVIALWLGHESVETTQIYLSANLALKQKILNKTHLPGGHRSGRYRPDDTLMAFLKGL